MRASWVQYFSVSLFFYPVASFLLLILTGAGVLMALPLSDGGNLQAIDALFMSTSAVCVTGLSVIDIGTRFTVWGQLTILTLIQLGGLGIMTLSTALLAILGRTLTFRSRFMVQGTYSYSPIPDVHGLLRSILLFTFSLEAVGAILLFLGFKSQFESSTAWYYAFFHAISAFCNAGFSPFSDSLMGFRSDPLIVLTVAGLFILGGIGFVVLHEMVHVQKKSRSIKHFWNLLSLHSKLVLSVTAWLLIAGTAFFMVSEWSTTLKELPFHERLLACFFQSATPRTAGFNTLDFGAMNSVTLLGTVILMFIGACPGSTGGGVKTSTLGVLLAMSRARVAGSETVYAFKRTLTEGTIDRSFGIFTIAVVIVLLGTASLLMSEVGSTPYKQSNYLVLELLFETTSAFGTVGLSTGITPSLSSWGKFILVLIMYTGRLGPLVLAMAIQPRRPRGRFNYAEEQVMIG